MFPPRALFLPWLRRGSGGSEGAPGRLFSSWSAGEAGTPALRQNPVAVLEDRHSLRRLRDARDCHSGEPIMKSVWIEEWLMPRAWRSSGGSSPASVDRLHDRRAERDVRGGVLVEERLAEDEPRLGDAGGRPSTSATSPSRAAPSSAATWACISSSPSSARTSTARPPSKRTSRPRTTVPWIWSG